MKILMVGALHFANFGDLLFFKLLHNEFLKEYPQSNIYIYETPVYKLNKACRMELSYEKHCRLSMLKDMDAVAYITCLCMYYKWHKTVMVLFCCLERECVLCAAKK